MGLFRYLFSEKERNTFYEELDSLEDVKKSFEHYLFFLHEKTSIIVEILNKYYDIEFKNKGYIQEDEDNYIGNNEKKFIYFYKRWVNNRLKRILKIINLELKSKFGLKKDEKDIVEIINLLRIGLEKKVIGENEDEVVLRSIISKLEDLGKNLEKQKSYFSEIYPIEDWTIKTHKDIFSYSLLKLVQEELEILFNSKNIDSNYNNFPAIISSAIHNSNFKETSTILGLLNNLIGKTRENAKINSEKNLIICYHARTIYINTPLLPLDTKTKGAGFFVDTDPEETIAIVKNLYDVQENEIELFELKIPKNLFSKAISDSFDPGPLKDVESMDNSYIFRPTVYPKFNEFYMKKLISMKKVTSLKK